MHETCSSMVIDSYRSGHKRFLEYVQKMTEEQIHWRPATGTHSIAWHIWHIARWTDYTQAAVAGMTPELNRRLGRGVQVWHSAGLAARWGLNAAQLGYKETGMYMTDEAAQHMTFPPKAELLDYLEKTFAAADHAANSIDEQQFFSAEQLQPLTEGIWGEATVGDAIMEHVIHDQRHLGMMESLLGLQGQPGTASQ